MRYFIDTEFIEGWKKPIKWLPTIGNFNKPYHSIQLISIGIVASDGREYYAISNEFDWRDASKWVVENVLFGLPLKATVQDYNDGTSLDSEMKCCVIPNPLYKSNAQIANEIIQFIHEPVLKKYDDGMMFADETLKQVYDCKLEPNHEFYAYYADYDWVLFCSLFGTMMDLPKGFPMFCIDLKQTFDEKQMAWANNTDSYRFMMCRAMFKNGQKIYSVEVDLKKLSTYPEQENEHNALSDAKWNLELYKFLQAL